MELTLQNIINKADQSFSKEFNFKCAFEVWSKQQRHLKKNNA